MRRKAFAVGCNSRAAWHFPDLYSPAPLRGWRRTTGYWIHLFQAG